MNRDPLAIVQDLAELIEAIDRRSPQLERGGESGIVEAAARLRVQAQARITAMQKAGLATRAQVVEYVRRRGRK